MNASYCVICGAPTITRDGKTMEHMPSVGVLLISAERARQVQVEGYTPEHDAQHTGGELCDLAAYYAAGYMDAGKRQGFLEPTDKDLIKAGALIAAELDRRAALAPTSAEV